MDYLTIEQTIEYLKKHLPDEAEFIDKAQIKDLCATEQLTPLVFFDGVAFHFWGDALYAPDEIDDLKLNCFITNETLYTLVDAPLTEIKTIHIAYIPYDLNDNIAWEQILVHITEELAEEHDFYEIIGIIPHTLHEQGFKVSSKDLRFSRQQLDDIIAKRKGQNSNLSERKEDGLLTTIGAMLNIFEKEYTLTQKEIKDKIMKRVAYGQSDDTLKTRFADANKAFERNKKK